MANDKQKRLRKEVHGWAASGGKKRGLPMPGHGKATNIGDPLDDKNK